ncbi:hypothetical protein GT348_08350 [Aristophania vespae]|uniref:Uncharacterized protein n=1 Tax=Aristophania vespae TaxID=2697033 RepID=A0A6P1NMZ9_9PROT|nr:hypothetical protein [Aristophania vespae]QHI96231.1 hypothetical protein GT348_08350 [Aristophania vespae]
MMGSVTGALGVIGSNIAANSGVITGGERNHNETSQSHSVISGNINVQAGSIEGHYDTDINKANGYLDNKFDAKKLANQLQNSRVGMQLVGEVAGQISDALDANGISGFGEGGIGRLIVEGGAGAAVGAITGGNPIGDAASIITGGLAAAQTRALAKQIGKSLSDDPNTQIIIANIISNGVAAGAGAATGAVVGSGNSKLNALEGAAASSALQQYNQANDNNPNADKTDKTTDKAIGLILTGGTFVPVVGSAASLLLGAYDWLHGNKVDAAMDIALVVPSFIGVGGEAKLAYKGGKYVYEGTEHALTNEANHATDSTISQSVNHGAGENKALSGDKETSAGTKDTTSTTDESISHSEQKTPREITKEEDIYTNSDGSVFGEDGSKHFIKEIRGNKDPNQAALDDYNKFKKLYPEATEVERIINGVKTKSLTLPEKDVYINYRPAGAASGRTPDTTATLDINTPKAQELIKHKLLKIKYTK